MEAWLRENPPRRSQFRVGRRAPKYTGCTVVHTAESIMDTIGEDTGTLAVARFIRDRTAPGSYHDLADSDSNLKLVRYADEAYQDGTGSNPFAMSISFCCKTSDWVKMSAEKRAGFLRQGALAFARQQEFLRRNGLPTTPLRRISKAESDRGVAGFISHGERDPGRRSDPGADFPWEEFFQACRVALGIETAPVQPAPTPAPAPPTPKKETDMFIVDDPDEPGGSRQWLCGLDTKAHIKTWPEVVAYRDSVGMFHFTEKPETVELRRALLAARHDVTKESS